MAWTNLVPAIGQARAYRREWLTKDVVAGLVLTGLLAPAGMAYAAAAGLPPVTGLYATIVPLFVYALFGPSRILVMGPDSSLTPLIVAAVLPLAAVGTDEAVALAGALGILAGVICVAAGLARFGFISELLSAPVRYGYLHGIAITIIVAQAAKLCGFSVKGETIGGQLRQFVDGLHEGHLNGWALSLGLASVATIVILRELSRKVPGTLIVVVLGVVVALALDLRGKGVTLVGDLPRGLPSPALPDVDWSTTRSLLAASLGIAFVAFADTSVMSRTMALRRHEQVDSNHELVALGLVNIASGMFHGFPISASNSRTPVAESVGSRTQLTGIVAGAALLVIAVAAPATFRHLPDASLAAIVIAAAISLIDIPAMVRLWRVRRSEFVLSIAAFLAVAFLGPINGVVVAVALSVLNFLRRAWKPHTAELVRVDGLKGYHDRARHPEGRVVPGLVLYRFDGPLFFANARFFVDDVQRVIDARPDPITCLIITAEPITDIDTTAADTLHDLVDQLQARGVALHFAELKGTVRERLERYGVFDHHDRPAPARTVGQAVKQYLAAQRIDWVDWEERRTGDGDAPPTGG
ncbi:MAG: SulP family inorganic anion transporter [Actinomycetota bacterium]|nr:SulP family inorganic anion transporter [Actinomycetota bacterium]